MHSIECSASIWVRQSIATYNTTVTEHRPVSRLNDDGGAASDERRVVDVWRWTACWRVHARYWTPVTWPSGTWTRLTRASMNAWRRTSSVTSSRRRCSSSSVSSPPFISIVLAGRIKPGFHYPSWRVTGFHYPSTRPVLTGNGNRSPVNSGR